MKRIFNTFLVFVFVLFVSLPILAQDAGKRGWREGEKQIRISNITPEIAKQLYELKLNMDFYGPAYDHIIVYAVPEELTRIEALHIPYAIEIEDLNEYNKDFWNREDQYHSYQQIIDLADSLAANFPGICKKYIYGYSNQNRQCAALKISDNVDVDEPEAEVMFDGGIHGDEIGGSENIIRFARDLCINYGVNPTITNLINTREIWLYLMVNPDGRYNMSRYNANGVDVNRDWGYMWDDWGGSSGAFSQIETKLLRDCMYNNQFVIHTTYHSGTEIISYPWSYRPNACADQSHINQLAGIYSSVSGYSFLEYGQGYNVMYPINGSTKDGNYGMMGSVSWSVEISNSKQPPASQIMTFYNFNYPSMMAMIEYSGYGLEGIVTDSVSGNPVTATVFINNFYPAYTDPVIGDYHKYVLPGTYSITVKANGYQSKTINNVVVTSNNSTITNFQMVAETGHYVYKFSSSRIPNNNFYDEGSTPAVIGQPDGINYSIGKSGWCVLDMQYPFADVNGADFIVHEGDATPEGYLCYVGTTIDGPWYLLGTGNGTTEFDILSSGLDSVQFIRIVDDGDGVANQANAGFDLDGVEAYTIVPVELVSFIAETIGDEIVLRWNTATELNNRGFEIERKHVLNQKSSVNSLDWDVIGFVDGYGTSTEVHSYSYIDQDLPGGKYQYRLKQIDFDGSHEYSKTINAEVNIVNEFSLIQNYPNPFNPVTKIKYSLANNGPSTSSSYVSLKVFDMLGNEIITLVNENKTSGVYEVDFNASDLASGVYIYSLFVTNNGKTLFRASKQMILIK